MLTDGKHHRDTPPVRAVKLGPADVTVERRGDGAILMRSPHPLPPYPRSWGERLAHWAQAAPDRIFLAQRDAAGAWRTMTYAQTLAAVRALAAAESGQLYALPTYTALLELRQELAARGHAVRFWEPAPVGRR